MQKIRTEVYLPLELKAQLKLEAERRNISVSQLIFLVLDERLRLRDKHACEDLLSREELGNIISCLRKDPGSSDT